MDRRTGTAARRRFRMPHGRSWAWPSVLASLVVVIASAGAALSVVLMVVGFLLLAMVSASLAALFVREEDAPHEAAEEAADTRLPEALRAVEVRLARLELALAGGSEAAVPETAADLARHADAGSAR